MIKNWNAIDGNIDRRSHHGAYQITENGLPLNPIGRTGIEDRGLLGLEFFLEIKFFKIK